MGKSVKSLLILLIVHFTLFTFLRVSEGAEREKKEEATLEEIVVTGEKLIVPTKQTGETVYTGSEITRKGIESQGEKARTNVYEAIDLLPGISTESPDPYGLASEQMNVRIRGVRGYLGAMTVEGIPNYGGNPMGPRAYVYNTENLESIAVYKGAVPGDLGTGVGDRGGAIEVRPRWASEKTNFELTQSLGKSNYFRTYLRLDSGAIPHTGSRASISYSYTEADKWKGPGGLRPRNNLNFTLIQPVGEKFEAKFWFNFNKQTMNKYYALTYNEIKNLGSYYRKDFNEALTGTPAIDIYYYDYNWESHINREYFGFISYKLTDSLKLTLKPYLSSEDAKIKDGSPNVQGQPGIQERTRKIERKGLIPEISYDTPNLKMVAGYLFEAADMDIYTENYWITPSGLQYRGYGVMATTGTTYINSPYFKVSGKLSKIDLQGGIKYFRFKDSDSEGYITRFTPSGTPYLDRASDLDRKGKIYDIWLPTAGIAYNFTDKIQAYFSYGRNYIRPYAYMPLISLYNQNRAAFQRANVTLNDLFEGYDIEKSHNFDLGLRIRSDRLDFFPTLFYAKHRNLLTVVSDPRVTISGKPASYQQNIGKATGYGADLELNLFLKENMTFFMNPTYTRLTYDQDISYQGAILHTKNKQVVDTPTWLLKTGIIWRYAGFEVTPSLRYVAKRYGDAEHKEEVGSYFVANLRASYRKENFWIAKEARFSFELDNIFNKHYVSVINAMDDARAGGTTYLVGSPFTALFALSMRF
jgi:iron complex outermembrane receptor protein